MSQGQGQSLIAKWRPPSRSWLTCRARETPGAGGTRQRALSVSSTSRTSKQVHLKRLPSWSRHHMCILPCTSKIGKPVKFLTRACPRTCASWSMAIDRPLQLPNQKLAPNHRSWVNTTTIAATFPNPTTRPFFRLMSITTRRRHLVSLKRPPKLSTHLPIHQF